MRKELRGRNYELAVGLFIGAIVTIYVIYRLDVQQAYKTL